MGRIDRGVSSFLDVTDGFGGDGESWRDKDWGKPYCMECGDEAVVLSSGTLRHRLTCPNPDCSTHGETDKSLKPWIYRLLLVAVVLLAVALARDGASLVTVVGVAVGFLLVVARARGRLDED